MTLDHSIATGLEFAVFAVFAVRVPRSRSRLSLKTHSVRYVTLITWRHAPPSRRRSRILLLRNFATCGVDCGNPAATEENGRTAKTVYRVDQGQIAHFSESRNYNFSFFRQLIFVIDYFTRFHSTQIHMRKTNNHST